MQLRRSRSLLQIAGCFTLLEKYEEARKYYGEVISEFRDRDEAKLAREKLARLPQ